MKDYITKFIARGILLVLSSSAKRSINNVCHYMSYQEKEPKSLQKYTLVK